MRSEARAGAIRRWRRWGSLGAVLLLLAAGLAAPPGATAQELSAARLRSKAAIVIDAHTGRVLFESNAHEPLPPASVTKVMTMLLVLEAIQEGRLGWDDMVAASARARSMGGTQIWLETGETMSVRDLLHAVALGSANDAAVALAEHLAGSEEAFAEWMNRRAAELGARNTHFSNASGLPPESVGMAGRRHVASAYDIAVISRQAVRTPGFLELVSLYGPYPIRPGTTKLVELWNLNHMLRTYPGMDGIKTGMTQAAGWCLAATAVRDGLRLIAVVLGAPSRDERTADVRTLLDWGFARFRAHRFADKGADAGSVPVAKGERERVQAVVAEEVIAAVPRDRSVRTETRIEWEPAPAAPVAAGQRLGRLRAYVDGEVVAEADVVAAQTVGRASASTLVGRTIRDVIGSLSGWDLR